MKPEFKDQTTLITGASAGIGAEFARQIAAEGGHLILVARTKERLESLAAELKKEYGVKVEICVMDLSKDTACDEIQDFVKSKNLEVDHLINNAGFGRNEPFLTPGAKSRDKDMIKVNVSALVELTHLFLPGMIQRKRGGVINVASTASFQPLSFLNVYAASKAFVLSFTEALWGEVRESGVRIFCLCPGNTVTEFHDKAGVKRRFLPATSQDLVAYGMRVYKHGIRQTSVHGWVNRILAQGYRFAPRFLTPLIGRMIYKR